MDQQFGHPLPRPRGRGAGVDEGGDDQARAHAQRGENLVEGRRKDRFDFLGYTFGPHART